MQPVCLDPVLRFPKAMTRRLAMCLTTALLSVSAVAQTAAPQNAGPHDAIFMNKAADREAWLLERARKEGGVTLYVFGPDRIGPFDG